MRKIISMFLLVVLGMLMLVTSADAGRRCPPRNKHCRVTPTATVMVVTATAGRISTIPVGTGTEIIYTCQALTCKTPGKP